MRFNIVAGEELKKIMSGIISNPIPFNEDMSVGTFSFEPFSEEFIKERSAVHHVSPEEYKAKLTDFLSLLKTFKYDDEIHLYFGEDKTCIANRSLLIEYFGGKIKTLMLHVVDELTGKEIKEPTII